MALDPPRAIIALVGTWLLCAPAQGLDPNYVPPAPTYRKYSNLHSEAIRQHVFNREGFSRIAPPISTRAVNYSDSGADVAVEIRFFKVLKVEPQDGLMELKVWFRLEWRDERLAWNISDFGGVTQTYYQCENYPGQESNEIWIPDVQPYNALAGTAVTLEPSVARVQNDGSVFLSRPGVLSIMCKFSGLVAFPFDELICPFELGGWTYSGGQQGLSLRYGVGWAFSNQELTQGSSYQEYRILEVDANSAIYEYDCCPSE